jgi:hypothetical protein
VVTHLDASSAECERAVDVLAEIAEGAPYVSAVG